MITGRQYLRSRQGEHSLIILSPAEFDQLLKEEELSLPARHAEHFSRVLRRAGNWPAIIGNGVDRLCEATMEQGEIRLTAAPFTLEAKKTPVTLAQAWIKPKSLSLMLQKSAEVGVEEIILFDCEHSATHSEKPQRIDAILENACMQAYNPVKPRIRFCDSLPTPDDPRIRCFFGDPTAASWLKPDIDEPSMFICGPEGGFAPAEIETLKGYASGVLISENVLRAETAAIIAAGILCLEK